MSVKFHEAYALDSQQDQLLWFDDFLGDQIQDEWRTGGTGSAAVVDQQTGGIARLTTGALTNNSYQIDWNNFRSLHVDQRVSFEARVKMANITQIDASIGLLFDASNQIVFVESAGDWLIRCEDGGAATQPNSGISLDIDYHIYRIECHTHGGNHVHFYIDGTETANSPINTNVPDDATDYLQPYLYIRTTEDVVKFMDIDYCVVRQDI